MTKTNKITAGQLFCMLFISRMVVNVTYSPYMAASGEMLDQVVSACLSIVFMTLIAIPIYVLHKRRPSDTLVDQACALTGRFLGALITVFYGLYFLFICGYNLSFYSAFVSSVMAPKFSLLLLASAVLLTACYGAFRGVEALARASGIIIVIVVACLVFFITALLFKLDPLNYTPLLYDGTDKMWIGVEQMIGRSSCIVFLGLLLPFTRGKVKKGFFTWLFSTNLTMIILILVIVGALGDFIRTQIYPIYAAASVAELGIFKRVDALFFAVWTTCLFIKVSLGLYLFSLCVKKFFGQKAAKFSIFIGAAAVFAYSLWTVYHENVTFFIYQMSGIFWITVTAALAVPLILLAIDLIKHGRRSSRES